MGAIGTALNSASILWALVPFASLGAVPQGHPFDVLYTYGFRYLFHNPRMPRYPLPPPIRMLTRSSTVSDHLQPITVSTIRPTCRQFNCYGYALIYLLRYFITRVIR